MVTINFRAIKFANDKHAVGTLHLSHTRDIIGKVNI